MNHFNSVPPIPIKFLGWTQPDQLLALYRNCRALVFPGVEDFGMVPVEVISCGRPVIAYKAGGALETVVDGITEIFFDEQTPESLVNAIERFEKMKFAPAVLHQHAMKFSYSKFYENIKAIIRGY